MDKILLPISCKNYHINFNLNLKSAIVLTRLVNPTPVSPNIYGALDIEFLHPMKKEKEEEELFLLSKVIHFPNLVKPFH